MKTVTFVLAGALLTSEIAFATTTHHLSIECNGVAQITRVLRTQYSPGREAYYRAPEVPPSGKIDVELQVSDQESAGCDLLHSKYAIDLSLPLQG